MIALAGVELETLVSEPDALTTRPPSCDNGASRRRTRNTRLLSFIIYKMHHVLVCFCYCFVK